MTMLSSSSPVTATTMLGGRWIPARSRTKISVASPCDDDVLELVLELLEPVAALLDQRHLVAGAEQAAREVRADLPAACDQDVHQAPAPGRHHARADGLGQAARSRSRSGRPCACPARRRTRRGAGSSSGRRRTRCRSASGRPGRRRCSCCRRRWRRRRRRPPRSRRGAAPTCPSPWPTTKPPSQPSPSRLERLLLLVDGDDVPAVPAQLVRDATSRRGRSRSRSPSRSSSLASSELLFRGPPAG